MFNVQASAIMNPFNHEWHKNGTKKKKKRRKKNEY